MRRFVYINPFYLIVNCLSCHLLIVELIQLALKPTTEWWGTHSLLFLPVFKRVKYRRHRYMLLPTYTTKNGKNKETKFFIATVDFCVACILIVKLVNWVIQIFITIRKTLFCIVCMTTKNAEVGDNPWIPYLFILMTVWLCHLTLYVDKIAIYGTRNPEQYLHTDIKLVMNNLICTVMRHEAHLVNIAATLSKKSHNLKTLL